MNMTRRVFLGSAAMAAGGAVAGGGPVARNKDGLIWAALLHMGTNMWCDQIPDSWGPYKGEDLKLVCAADHVRFDEKVWRVLTDRMVKAGMNMVIIDLGEAVRYPSHPELAVKGSWDVERFRKELGRLRKMGLEPIPKMNFSAAHDTWLREYERMLSTEKYYQVCSDLIRDVAEIFDHPRFLHIGYDEERISHQKGFQCIRTDEVWWHDFLWFVKTVEDAGMRPWMWSDYGWKHDDFVSKCPKSVVHNNWYYDEELDGFDLAAMKPNASSRPYVELFLKLDKAGFDQVPCSSNWCSPTRIKAKVKNDDCMAKMVKFCRTHLSPEHLKGFLMAPWSGDYDEKDFLQKNFNGIDQLAAAMV